MPCYKIHITGSVFKTGFRYYLKDKALFLGITGKVYYVDESTVGVIASGTSEKMFLFLEFCETSNHFVQITNIDISKIPPQEFTSFEVDDEIPITSSIPGNNYKPNQNQKL